MTDKLPEWVEKKLDSMQMPLACAPSDYAEGCRDGYNEAIDDLRAFLAQYALCSPIAVDCHECSGEGYFLTFYSRTNRRIVCKVCNKTGKLYAPAKGGGMIRLIFSSLWATWALTMFWLAGFDLMQRAPETAIAVLVATFCFAVSWTHSGWEEVCSD